jgi:periplasmic divalent cation tolerance protein
MDTASYAPSAAADASPSPDAVIVLTTWPADKDPLAFARLLIDERLAACVNLLPPMTSVYRWQGDVQEDPERQLIIKTTRARVDEVIDRLRARHPYELPECLVLPIERGGAAYLTWLSESVAAGER